MRSRWWHQCGNAGYEFERREVQLIRLCPVLCTSVCVALVSPLAARLAVQFGAAIDQLAARFAQPLTRKRRARAVAQQPLQARAVLRGYAHAGVYRETAVAVCQHLFGLKTLQQAPSDESAQERQAQTGLGFVHGIRIHAGGGVEDDTCRAGLRTGFIVSIALARHFLKHAIDHANVEVHMLVQTGAKAVDEGDCAYVQGRPVCLGGTGAVGLQGLAADHRAVVAETGALAPGVYSSLSFP